MFHGISMRGSLPAALALARELNARKKLAASSLPPWTHVVQVEVDGEQGHAFARTLETKDHFTVWGEAEHLASRVVAAWTIEGKEVTLPPERSV